MGTKDSVADVLAIVRYYVPDRLHLHTMLVELARASATIRPLALQLIRALEADHASS